ncbi:MAG: CHAT domain-containing tetratricopeptide repeat protein [Hyphomicrobiaceae bacterium]|nr:CHAT domain-containing tetratricopeptide repeat protein [Hyphomicrobiaceae bacterium]
MAGALCLVLAAVSGGARAQPVSHAAATEADRLAAEFSRLVSAGKAAEALLLGERALALGVEGYGPDSVSVGHLHVNLASALKTLARYGEAEPHYQKGLALIARHYGQEHIEVSHVVHELGEMRHRQGRLDEAEPLYRRALDIRSKVPTANPLALAVSLNSMGLMRQLRGPQTEALSFYRRALAIREAELASGHPDIGQSYNNIGSLLHELGRREEALPLLLRGLAIWEAALPADHGDVILGRDNLAHLHEDLGDFPKAEALFRSVLASFERVRPADHGDTARALNNLGLNLKRQGALHEAETLYKRALAMKMKVLPPGHTEIAQTLNNLAALYRELSRPAEAEPLYQQALSVFQAALPDNHPDIAMALNNLGSFYQEQGRHGAAEPLLKRTVEILEGYGDRHPNLAKAINNLALVYARQDQPARAEPLLRRSLQLRMETLPTGHPEIAAARNNLGQVLLAQGKASEAGDLLRLALADLKRALSEDHPNVATVINNLADVAEQQAKWTEAEALYSEALALRQKVLPRDHLDVAHSHNNIATLYTGRQNWARAVEHWTKSTALLAKRTDLGVETLGASLVGRSEAETKRWSWQFWGLAKVAHKLKETAGDPNNVLRDQSFVAAQWAAASEAAASLSQMGVRAAAERPELAAIVRERQDLVAKWQSLDDDRTAIYVQRREDRDARSGDTIASRLQLIESRIAEIDQQLGREFPNYAELVKFAPLGIQDVQALLAPTEALILTLDTRDWSPLPEETFIWVVTKTTARWLRSSLGTAALDEEVAALRCGLDAASWDGDGGQRCRTLLGIAGEGPRPAVLPFDAPRAHKLHRAILGEATKLTAGKSLLIVPTGPLARLPWQVLVASPPGPAQAGSQPRWLIRDHALTVLPSVSSLKVLRRFARASGATGGMLAFANPILDGDETGLDLTRHVKLVLARRAARYRQSCDLPPSDEELRLANSSGLVGNTWGAAATAADVRRWPPVPSTGRLVCDIAADPNFAGSKVLLGDAATERGLRDLNASGDLARYRVVQFATHGALAGEVAGVAEPGLVLTPPSAGASTSDDGFLAASEIVELKLDADYVILSACNTAAGGQTGGEALSGLARAFIYAGTRTLLVSHWAVFERAAVTIVTAATRTASKQTPGRAEAMRAAMLALIDKGDPVEAHPSYWAPFAVVGDGGAGGTPQQD